MMMKKKKNVVVSEDLMFALVRNDDGHPVIIEIFSSKNAAEKAKKHEGSGYFIEEIDAAISEICDNIST